VNASLRPVHPSVGDHRPSGVKGEPERNYGDSEPARPLTRISSALGVVYVSATMGVLFARGVEEAVGRRTAFHGQMVTSRVGVLKQIRRQFRRVADLGLAGNAGLVLVPRMRSSATLSALSSFAFGGT
jgi:hypothetical protein